MPDHGERKILGLDRTRLAESAVQAATVMALGLLIDRNLGSVLELRMLAVLLSYWLLFTLALYGMHVLFRDRTRDEQMRKQWRKWRQARRRRRTGEEERR